MREHQQQEKSSKLPRARLSGPFALFSGEVRRLPVNCARVPTTGTVGALRTSECSLSFALCIRDHFAEPRSEGPPRTKGSEQNKQIMGVVGTTGIE